MPFGRPNVQKLKEKRDLKGLAPAPRSFKEERVQLEAVAAYDNTWGAGRAALAGVRLES